MVERSFRIIAINRLLDALLEKAAGPPDEAFGLPPRLLDPLESREVRKLLTELAALDRERPARVSVPRAEIYKARPGPKPRSMGESVPTVGELFTDLGYKPRNEMICMILYDISDNRVRKEISDFLEAKGCQRIQRSVFMGQIDRRQYRAIEDELQSLNDLYEANDTVVMIPISEDEIHQMKMIGKPLAIREILDRRNSLFF